jgi:1-deoxy-D-xylulose-5-phosphate reductoisomerase
MKKKIAILGSTGSIGSTTLNIIKKTKLFEVILLLVNNNIYKTIEQINRFKPKIVVIIDKKSFLIIKERNKNKKIIILNNLENINKYLKKVDITVSAIPGIAGLKPTVQFIKLSKKILIANKEAVVCGWNLIKSNSKKYKTELVSIDSEHFSIQELTKNYSNEDIDKIYITASGGPFLNFNINKFKNIKPKAALKHPKWKMGSKISIDSATLMNKVLEIIEAIRLFPFNFEKYEVIIHPQSLVHAIVKFNNGITKFLYHETDMSVPIANALFNFKLNFKKNNLLKIKNNSIQNLEFIHVDKKRFPAINLVSKKNMTKSAPIILNAANEIFVDQFLKSKISFNSIYTHLLLVLKDKNYIKYAKMQSNNLKAIYKIDKWARDVSLSLIDRYK